MVRAGRSSEKEMKKALKKSGLLNSVVANP